MKLQRGRWERTETRSLGRKEQSNKEPLRHGNKTTRIEQTKKKHRGQDSNPRPPDPRERVSGT
jgi:hypothetical protein